MISVLVPVFNIDVVSMVSELNRQLENLQVDGEILVFDDFSSSNFKETNRAVANLNFVIYRELNQNYGRSSIRKLLASNAKYPWLLFLDSDSRIMRPDFLERYASALKDENHVYIGGRIYPKLPSDCDKRLHWKYGASRESVKGNKSVFHTNNFCIGKKIFEAIQFPEIFRFYGHEDTWMGIELERLDKKLIYLNNAVEHTHIESSDVFLNKTKEALQNLLLIRTLTGKKELAKHVSLFRSFVFIQKTGLQFAVTLLYKLLKNKITHNLYSCNPSLVFFDFYRLYNLICISKQVKEKTL